MKIPIYSAVKLKRERGKDTVAALNVGAGTFRYAFGAGNYQAAGGSSLGGGEGTTSNKVSTALFNALSVDLTNKPTLKWLSGINVRTIDISKALKLRVSI